jgi:hypothetical protein
MDMPEGSRTGAMTKILLPTNSPPGAKNESLLSRVSQARSVSPRMRQMFVRVRNSPGPSPWPPTLRSQLPRASWYRSSDVPAFAMTIVQSLFSLEPHTTSVPRLRKTDASERKPPGHSPAPPALRRNRPCASWKRSSNVPPFSDHDRAVRQQLGRVSAEQLRLRAGTCPASRS